MFIYSQSTDSDLQHNNLQNTHHTFNTPDKNINIRAAFIHIIGDLIQSIGVCVAAIVIKFKVIKGKIGCLSVCFFLTHWFQELFEQLKSVLVVFWILFIYHNHVLMYFIRMISFTSSTDTFLHSFSGLYGILFDCVSFFNWGSLQVIVFLFFSLLTR